MKLLQASLLTAIAVLVTGCSSIELDSHANRIIASPNAPAKGCKYVGQVVGNQGNFFTGAYTSNKNLEIGAMNDMKNQASKLGANYIQLINSRAGNTGSVGGYDGMLSGGMSQTNVTNMGNAYSCPASALS